MTQTTGFTLVELAVAVAILAIGMMAAWHSMQAASYSIGTQLDRILAHEVALNRAAELRLMGLSAGRSLRPTVVQGPFIMTVNVTGKNFRPGLVFVEIFVHSPGKPGARISAIVPE